MNADHNNSDAMCRHVADGIRDMLNGTDSKVEEMALLQLIAGTAIHGVATTLPPHLTISWLNGYIKLFQDMSARQNGGVH